MAHEPACVIRYADGDEEEWPIEPELLAAARVSSRSAARPLQRPSYLFEGLRAQPFWPFETFPKVVALLEACAPDLSEEVQTLLEDELSDSSEESGTSLSRTQEAKRRKTTKADEKAESSSPWQQQGEGLHQGVWLKLEIWAKGGLVSSAKAVPRASAAISAAMATGEAMAFAPGRAALSYMMCGVDVSPHCGPTNHRLRLHLPLLLPKKASRSAGLTVAGEARDWELHKCLIFDDSFEHEVKLPTFTEPEVRDSLLDEARVVLLLDLWHPDAGFLKETAESRALPRAKELSDKRLQSR